MDKWFKRIWLVNGVLVLLALFMALFFFIAESNKSRARKHRTQAGPQVVTVVEDSLVTQDISLSLPVQIGTTDFAYVAIGVKDLAQPQQMTIGMKSSQAVNLLFCRLDGTLPRLLLDQKAFIVGIDIPSARDTLQDFNLYRIVLEDTDGDQRLTSRDEHRLYISHLDGTGLMTVLPDGVHCTSYSLDSIARQLILVTRANDQGAIRSEDQPEEILVYDLRTRAVRSFLDDDEVIKRARRLLWDR